MANGEFCEGCEVCKYYQHCYFSESNILARSGVIYLPFVRCDTFNRAQNNSAQMCHQDIPRATKNCNNSNTFLFI